MDAPEAAAAAKSNVTTDHNNNNKVATARRRRRSIKALIIRYSIPFLLAIFLLSILNNNNNNFNNFNNNFFSFIPNPVSIASQCTILSTSVDLRSSKVCELGLLNYKAKNVFYPSSHTTKFRCRHDYYWASVFKVDYREYSSGQTRRASVEVPKEALPIDCRPSFGVAWLTKEKFKVNKTYNCRYTPGVSQVDLYSDSLFNCHAKDPSAAEMTKRYFILFTRMIYFSCFGVGKPEFAIRELVAGIVAGMFTALISVSLVRLLQTPKSRVAATLEPKRLHSAVHDAQSKRVCFRVFFLVLYLSLMGWLTIQYGKIVGLTKIFTNYQL